MRQQAVSVKWVFHLNVPQESEQQSYLVLVHTPYPDDGVSSSGEEPVQRRIQLERIHPVSIVLFHFISNDIGHLTHREGNEQGVHLLPCADFGAFTR